MPHLFDELLLRGIKVPNRIGVSPMCQYSCEDGKATDWHLVHLGSRAVGGAGLVTMEATAVEARGRISPSDNGIWSEEHVEPLQRITRFLAERGSVPAIQLAHAGRKASRGVPWQGGNDVPPSQGGWETIAPSALAFSETYRAPSEMSCSDIDDVTRAFAAAAARALDAGFEMVEIHGAHGYLVHSFLSPVSNQRDDDYGGSFDNRVRFVLGVADAIRKVWPERLPLGIRLSCTDWVPGGWTLEESVELSRRLRDRGVDIVDCSSGGLVASAEIPVGAGYQVQFASAIRAQAGIKTAAVGLITEPMQADDHVRNGRADLILLGRELLRDPYWPLRAARAVHHADRARVPAQYLRAF